MMYRNVLTFSTVILVSTLTLQGAVDDITGDTGGAQTGSLTVTGGTSGAVFSGSSSTVTQSFNFLKMPATTSTNGQIIMGTTAGADTVLHIAGNNQNVFVGTAAGNFTVTGGLNVGCGDGALNVITSGTDNTAVGQASLVSLTSGNDNTAVGFNSGSGITTGVSNTLIGISAGAAYSSSESNNIVIGGGNTGANGESNTTRIGSGQTTCFVDGIYGATVDTGSGLTAYVDANGQLGTVASTADVKEHIKNIGNDSKAIFKLRPIKFNLKKDPKKLKQYGLLAEEVIEEMPELVIKKDGKPYAIRYDELPVLLLNEMQKMADKIEKLEDHINKLEHKLAPAA